MISLEELPFPDAEFDFVRIRNIGLGIPEDEVSHKFSKLRPILTAFAVAKCYRGSYTSRILRKTREVHWQ